MMPSQTPRPSGQPTGLIKRGTGNPNAGTAPAPKSPSRNVSINQPRSRAKPLGQGGVRGGSSVETMRTQYESSRQSPNKPASPQTQALARAMALAQMKPNK